MALDALTQTGLVGGDAQDTEPHMIDSPAQAVYPVVENDKDYFVEKDGMRFAGTHLLVEIWDAVNLDDPERIENILCQAATTAGATILHSHMHHFSPYSGVSGVVVLAESHISIHTWPERSFAAIDLFMCGECDPNDAIPVLREGFKPGRLEVDEYRRGIIK